MIREMGYSEILYTEKGKPFLKNGFVSITHSGNWMGIQVSKKSEVGIDIEKIHDRILKIKDRFLSEKEIKEVCSGEIEKMTLCWSAKEAIFKKYGGETVFFKDKIEILKINIEKKVIEFKLNTSEMKSISSLEYFYPENDHVLVHTL
jgi:phosphopantetheine--protein transferase-like protein